MRVAEVALVVFSSEWKIPSWGLAWADYRLALHTLTVSQSHS